MKAFGGREILSALRLRSGESEKEAGLAMLGEAVGEVVRGVVSAYGVKRMISKDGTAIVETGPSMRLL